MAMPPFIDMTGSSIQSWFNGFFQVYSVSHYCDIKSSWALWNHNLTPINFSYQWIMSIIKESKKYKQ